MAKAQSRLQRQRSSCLREQLKGRHYKNQGEQRKAFGAAVKACARKFPNRSK